jgi:uncharacterized protein DUF2779
LADSCHDANISIVSSYLSKSDFKVAQDCPTKLYYKKQHYPCIKDEDEYLAMLAEGGYMIQKIAHILHPEGQEIRFDLPPEDAFHTTQEALKSENVTLFEPTFISNGKLARVDILRKRGNEFDLVEIKAKSYDSKENAQAIRDGYQSLFRNKDGSISAKWQEYLEDVAFQVQVLQELFPGSIVRPYLCMPDKSKTTNIDRLYSQFRLRRVPREGSRHEQIVVDFLGDAERLRSDHFLVEVSVADEVLFLAEDVRKKAEQYAASLQPRLKKIVVPLKTVCADCEYHAIGADTRDGFRECWGSLADVKPHILDLYHVGQIGGHNGITADDLIGQKRVSLFNIPEDSLRKKDGSVGANNARQAIQINHTRENTEWIGDQLRGILQSYKYPLYFIDFETTTIAVPYHAGMHPYEPVAFQWSCHTLAERGADLVHHEWINVDDVFPNFEFAKSLMLRIGTHGTVFKYAAHETTILKAIRRQIDTRGHRDAELARWLDEMSQKGRLVDMYQDLTLKHYYHPLMRGENSIKRVVDAIWKIDSLLRERFPEYVRQVDGELLSPYEALPPLEIQGNEVVVAQGTGAMRAYEAMMYGLERDDAATLEQWKRLLQQYCKLDSLGMAILWLHWTGVLAWAQ